MIDNHDYVCLHCRHDIHERCDGWCDAGYCKCNVCRRNKMEFAEAMQNNPPRLVVLWKKERETDLFQWGIVGNVPALSLIGAIVNAQARLVTGDFMVKECSEQALAIVFKDDVVHYFVHHIIPVDPLIGMLETIKAALVGSRMAQHALAQQTPIVGPDGKPIRR